MPILQRRKIHITQHAKQRLLERVKSHDGYPSWEALVSDARYKGTPETAMTQEACKYIDTRLDKQKRTNSMNIRLFKGFFYIFRGDSGHSRTLVTVIEYSV